MFSDTPRSGAKQAIEALRGSGAGIAMLTGDETKVALGVAEAVGIASDQVYAEQQPEAKSARIVAAQTTGCSVAFVGDGLNDAPALAAADLGIAVGRRVGIVGGRSIHRACRWGIESSTRHLS